MDKVSTGALVVLLLASGFFSAAETSMMAISRYRLRHAAGKGDRGAQRTYVALLEQPTNCWVILPARQQPDQCCVSNALHRACNPPVWRWRSRALYCDLIAVYLILIFSEVTPKVVGAAYPALIGYPASFILGPLLKLVYPVVDS